MRQILSLAILVALGLPLAPGGARATECVASAPAYEIGPEEARHLYACVEAAMANSYAAASDAPGVAEFRNWTLLSTSPFVSATHGSLMINHHANPVAEKIYTKWEAMAGQKFPAGSILAKESYSVAAWGEVRPGPLFLMEKAEPGTAPETDDWIYTRVFTNGRVQRTLGAGGDRLNFCHDCHAATIDDFDAMFFPPEEFRIQIE
jgi:hypothetical protein